MISMRVIAICAIVSMGVWGQNYVGIGIATPGHPLEVYVPYSRIVSGAAIHTSSVTVEANMPADGQQGIIAYHLRNSALPYTWRLWYADPDGGYGVGAYNFEIWEYPDQTGGGGCCRARFRIATTYPATSFTLTPVTLSSGNAFYAYGYTNLSDSSFKFSVHSLGEALAGVRAIRPVRYQWRGNREEWIGFLAQDVQGAFPHLVRESERMRGISWGALIATLTQAVKELEEKVALLEAEVTQLESRKNCSGSKR